jgi:hypothetical protein
LLKLTEKCEYFDKSFKNIDPECNRLNGYSVEPRYPSETEYTEYNVRKTLVDTEKVYTFTPIVESFAAAKAYYEKNYVTKTFNATLKPKNFSKNDDSSGET